MNKLARLGSSQSGLVKRSDFFSPFEEVFDSFFSDFFSTSSLSSVKAKANYPKINAYNNEGKYCIEACVPGMKEDELTIEIKEDAGRKLLTISGKKQKEKQVDENNYYHREVHRSSFSRSFYLPENLEGDPETSLENGLLSLVWKTKSIEAPLENKSKIIPINKKIN